MNIAPVERRPVIVGDAAALAPGFVVRGELCAQLRITDRILEMFQTDTLQACREPTPGPQGKHANHVHERPQEPSIEPHQDRRTPKQRLPFIADIAREPRKYPRRRTLEHRHLGDVFRDGGQDLNRTCASSHDTDATPLEVVVVIPFSGVKDGSGKRIQAVEFCMIRQMQSPETAHHDVGRDRRVVPDFDFPSFVGTVPHEANIRDIRAETNVRFQVVFLGDLLTVFPDLAPTRIGMAPIRIQFERKRIDVGRHVTCNAGVGVFAPGSADAVGLLENDKVVSPSLLQLDTHADARHSRAENHNAIVLCHALDRLEFALRVRSV